MLTNQQAIRDLKRAFRPPLQNLPEQLFLPVSGK